MKKQNFSVYISSILLIFTLIMLSAAIGCSKGANGVERRIKNLEAFTKLYGYVKHFYPGDEAAGMDWDNFAIYGAHRVEMAAGNNELKSILEELFLPIAPALVIFDAQSKPEFSTESITPPDTTNMKVVSWQHRGIGFGSVRSLYASIRLNRDNILIDKGRHSMLTQVVLPNNCLGKEIKLKASVKVKEGKGLLWLRVDRKGNKRGFFYNMNDRPIETNTWKEYEFTGTVHEDAKLITFGCILLGDGQLWVDNFQLLFKKNEQWKPIELKNPGFEDGEEGKTPTNWNPAQTGYTSKITSDTASEGNKCVTIKSEPFIKTIRGPLFKENIKFGEFITKSLGSGLTCHMPLALYGSDSETFPKAPAEKLDALNKAIQKFTPKELTGDNPYVRYAGIVKAWNVFQHFYPYFDVVKTDWNAVLSQSLRSAAGDNDRHDFLKTMQLMVAALKDGHGRVTMTNDISKTYSLPITWEWVENNLVITNVLDPELKSISVGDIVEEIDGVKAKDVLEEAERFISGATPGWIRYRSQFSIARGPENSSASLKIKKFGKNTSVSITLKRSKDVYSIYNETKGTNPPHKIIEEGIHYLNIGTIPMNKIEELMPQLEKAKAIICDLRGYPIGNDKLINHLLSAQTVSQEWMWAPQVIYPDYEKVTYRKTGWQRIPAKPHLNAKIVFITDGRAISYAESFMGFIEGYNLAEIVGQPTAGTNGNINPFEIPGGYKITWTGMRVVKHDGSQHHGIGILPTFPTERSIKGIAENRDELLEKAVEVAKI
jgi:C-terminal processing protease CtpA/Prc